MVLFVDETENDEYFIVTGLLVNSQLEISEAYSHFKKRADKLKISPKIKSKLFTEFKSTLLDKSFQRIKAIMIEELKLIDYHVIYSCHIKKTPHFSQETKEKAYIQLLHRIVEAIDIDVDIIFDTFNKADFEDEIVLKTSELKNVKSICCCDSQLNPGLQYVDNLCSICRHHMSGTDKNAFYEIIKDSVKMV